MFLNKGNVSGQCLDQRNSQWFEILLFLNGPFWKVGGNAILNEEIKGVVSMSNYNCGSN